MDESLQGLFERLKEDSYEDPEQPKTAKRKRAPRDPERQKRQRVEDEAWRSTEEDNLEVLYEIAASVKMIARLLYNQSPAGIAAVKAIDPQELAQVVFIPFHTGENWK
jgi:hypothetical protein